ncbi:MAG: response regulator [Leptospirales bacterium]|nr:response regulator [Leptospirales bacterium]
MKDSDVLDILLVDDEVEVTEELALYLETKGLHCSAVRGGREALQVIQQNPPRLVLTDYAMPRMTGLELLQQIHRLKPDLPVIMMSGNADLEVWAQALKDSAYDYLEKPLHLKGLLSAADRALRGEPSLWRRERAV